MKLPTVSGKEVIKTLKMVGFVAVRQRGSHVRLEKTSNSDIIKVTVPLHTPLKKGTLCRIIKDAGFTNDEFIDLQFKKSKKELSLDEKELVELEIAREKGWKET